MLNDWIDELKQALSEHRELGGMRFVRQQEGGRLSYPLTGTLVSLGCEGADKLGFLLGCDGCLFSGEALLVRVMTDEKNGGAFCEQQAESVCRALLEIDGQKRITSVCVEKCMYDRTAFAYNIVMRFTLRERAQAVQEGIA